MDASLTIAGPTDPSLDDAVPSQTAAACAGLVTEPGLPTVTARATRLATWTALTLLAAFSALFWQPLAAAPLALALSGMVSAALVGPADRRTSLVAMLPLSFLLVVVWAIIWGLLGSVFGWCGWGSWPAALLGLAVLGALTGRVSAQRGGAVVIVGRDWPAAAGAAGLATFLAWTVASQPLAWWSRINASGTDFLRHVGSAREALLVGHLVPAEPGYPKSIYALSAWLGAVLRVEPTGQQMWKVVAPIGFLMLVLMALAIMALASRLVDGALAAPTWRGPVAATVALGAFLQTAWFSTFQAFGSVMNVLVGLCLVALLAAGQQAGTYRSTVGSLAGAAAVAVTANSWQLMLPVVGLTALPFGVAFLRMRRRRALDWAVWLLAAALCANGVLGLRELDTGAQTAISTVSNLFHPEWWWWVAVAMAVVAVAAARRGAPWWASSALGSLVGGAGLVAGLMLVTGSTWELMRYYPVKALWTSMVTVIPLAAAGGILVVVAVWRRAPALGSVAGPLVRGVAVLVVGLVVAGVVGRGAAFQPHLALMAQGRSGMPNWALAALDSLEGTEIPEARRDGAVVFGVVPEAGLWTVQTGYVGTVDFLVMEALALRDVEGALDSPVKLGLLNRDMTRVCRYLMDHPDSFRITGPNVAAGPEWILASGCPRDMVRPDRWVSLTLDPIWLERTAWEGASAPWDFPDFQEVRDAAQDG